MPTINLDLSPYDVAINQDHISVRECSGSVLEKLNTDISVTNNRFSVDRQYTEMEDGWWTVNYDQDDRSCNFYPCGRNASKEDLESVSNWIRDNYSAIESIEYEVLQGDPDRYM